MKTKKTIIIVVGLLLCFLLIACSPQEGPAASEEEPNESNENVDDKIEIDLVRFSTGDATGSWMSIGAGIAEKANEFFVDYPINAIPGAGSVGNPPIISIGDADLGMSYGPFLQLAIKGEAPYDIPSDNLRAICALPATVVHFFVDSNISANTVSELIEEKIPITLGLMPTGQGSNYIAQIVFSALGYDNVEDIEEYGSDIYYASGSSISDAWKDRHIDAAINTYNVPASAIMEMLLGRKGKILEFDGDLKEMLVNENGFTEYIIPAGTYEGQDEDVLTVALPTVIFTREDMSEDAVYYITKSIYESKDYLVGVHSSFNEFNPDLMHEGLGIEMHKGAEKFYKEIGLID